MNPFNKDSDRLYYLAYQGLENELVLMESACSISDKSYMLKRRDAITIASVRLANYSFRLVKKDRDNPSNQDLVNKYRRKLATDIICSALTPDASFYFRDPS